MSRESAHEFETEVPPGTQGEALATEAYVRTCYRLFLGREPESQKTIEEMLRSWLTVENIRQRFISSPEFRQKASLSGGVPLDCPPMSIQTDVSDELLQRMLRHIENNWRILGQTEPHWSVITNPSFTADKIGANLEAFFESGAESFTFFRSAVERCGLSLPSRGICFELGCGVGRVTLQLARAFATVVAGDISESHLHIAEETAGQSHVSNIEFVHINSIDMISQLPDFDSFYSVIVLQHNPPPVIKAILRRVFAKLKPGGLGYFQVPTYGLNYVFDAQRYMNGTSSDGKMEVHVLPQWEVLKLITEEDCELLEVREDGWIGTPEHISNSFLVSKRGRKNKRKDR